MSAGGPFLWLPIIAAGLIASAAPAARGAGPGGDAPAGGEPSPRVAALVRAMACSADPRERLDAVDTLRCLPAGEADAAAPALARLCGFAEDPGLRKAAEWALFDLCREPADIGPRTVAALLLLGKHWCADTLHRIPADRREELIRRAFADPDLTPADRLQMTDAAFRAGLAGRTLVSALTGIVGVAEFRDRAMLSLVDLGPAAADGLPAVRAAVAAGADPFPAGVFVLRATGRLDEAAGLLFRRGLRDHERLSLFDEADLVTARDVPTLIGWLDSPSADRRLFAVEGLGRIGAAAGPGAVAALRRQLAVRDGGETIRVAEALGRFGPAASAAVDDLLALAAEDPNEQVRGNAVRGRRSAPAVPVRGPGRPSAPGRAGFDGAGRRGRAARAAVADRGVPRRFRARTRRAVANRGRPGRMRRAGGRDARSAVERDSAGGHRHRGRDRRPPRRRGGDRITGQAPPTLGAAGRGRDTSRPASGGNNPVTPDAAAAPGRPRCPHPPGGPDCGHEDHRRAVGGHPLLTSRAWRPCFPCPRRSCGGGRGRPR